MSPELSLVLAAWNPRADWLELAVRRALDGDVASELVVVDDGSTIPVAELLAGVEDERLRVVRVPHGGESRARNAGIEEARGEFIRFIDADDVCAEGSNAHLLALARSAPGSIAYGATAVCDEELRPVWTMRSRLQGNVVRECLLGRWWVRVPSLVFPRAVVDAAGEWDPGFRLSHDWDFVLRALEHAPVVGDTTVVTYYRKHGASATADTRGSEEGAQRVIERYFERRPELRGTALERQARAATESLTGRVLLSRLRPLPALPRFARALAVDPGAVVNELSQAVPALVGQLRRLLRRR